MSDNNNLQKAKEEKNDEFYTLRTDIEKELVHYTDHLRGKIIYCCADNPDYSQFWAYFRDNFKEFGLKELVSTHLGGKITTLSYEGIKEIPLMGDGDFRSEECLEIMDRADIIITNPPFSLFRDLINILIRKEKKFVLLGGMNNITYKDMFPHLQEKRFILGVNSGSFRFLVPSVQGDRDNLIEDDGYLYAKFGNICWYTNIDHGIRNQPLTLTESYEEDKYPLYDNYPARDVNSIKKIPRDYYEPLGVPVTILQHLDYDQFLILGNLGSYGVDGYSLAPAIYINGKKLFKRILIRRTREEDFLYRPSKYEISWNSLEEFSSLFNITWPFMNLELKANEVETYDNDGYIIDHDTGNKIGFDWEIRDRYFSNGIFRFDTLGQYERKIKKKSIDLSIQCDKEQKNIIVAWHEDFLRENQVQVPCSTDEKKQEDCRVRYTKYWKIYSYDSLFLFKAMLQRAMKGVKNHEVF